MQWCSVMVGLPDSELHALREPPLCYTVKILRILMLVLLTLR
jgi:hypothetical protein